MLYSTKYGLFSVYENDVYIVRYFKLGLVYEEDFIIKYLKPLIEQCRVVLDVGAHIGSHTITYTSLNPAIIVHSFEPQKKVFNLLKQNVLQNNLEDRVNLYNVCVGNNCGDAELAINASDDIGPAGPVSYGDNVPRNIGGVSIGKGGEKVSMISIDSLNLEICDFIKIDIEGYEPLAITGAMDTIHRCRPVICFEKNDKTMPFEEFGLPNNSNIFDMLLPLGYVVYYASVCNYLAFPLEKVNMTYNF